MEQFLVVGFAIVSAVVLLNFILTLAIIRKLNRLPQSGSALPMEEALEVGTEAPNFTAETLNGERVTLSDYRGREVAFIFLSPSCGPCRAALPRYEALAPQARLSGTEIVLVSVADADQTRTFVEENNITTPVIVAALPKNSFMQDYKLAATPSYCLVDGQGKVLSSGRPSFEEPGAWKTLTESWLSKSTPLHDLVPI